MLAAILRSTPSVCSRGTTYTTLCRKHAVLNTTRLYSTPKEPRKMGFKDIMKFMRKERTSMIILNFVVLLTLANGTHVIYQMQKGEDVMPTWLKEATEAHKKKLQDLKKEAEAGNKIPDPKTYKKEREVVPSFAHVGYNNPYKTTSPPPPPSPISPPTSSES